jgi:sortase (surface protein transpeptidase)
VKQSDYKESETTDTNSVFVSGRRKTSILQKMIYAFASLVVVFSGFVSVQSFITNNQAKEQIATLGEAVSRDEQGVSEGTGNEPSEEPISQSVVANYQVPNPEDPRFLRIPSLGVFSRIKNLGVTPEGAVDAPRNIYDTGWYNGSARPGSRVGSSLILGHVSGWTGPGVFKKINELPAGGEFEIEKGTGEVIKYSVVRSEQIPLDQIDMSKVLSTEEAGKHDLKLMTCSGRYNSSTETFEDRFIVYAKQI